MFDVAVIGPCVAGLAAAFQLGRTSRSVVGIDAGSPPHRTPSAAHGLAGWDGVAPGKILARFRAYFAAAPKVQTRDGTVMRPKGGPGVFAGGAMARPMPTINFALADGAQVGSACHVSLLFPDVVTPRESAA